MIFPTIVSFLVVIVAVIIGYTLCGDVTNIRHSNSWPQLGNANKNVSLEPPQWNVGQKSTTPWPALAQPRNQQSNLPQNNGQASRVSNNSPAWVRNTPPNGSNNQRNANIRGNLANYNTNFLNSERGQVGMSSQNNVGQKQNIGTVNQIQNVNVQPVRPMGVGNGNQVSNKNVQNKPLVEGGGGGSNQYSNKGMSDIISTGPIKNNNNDARAPTVDQNQGSDTQNNGGVEDYELREFSEELLLKDINNAARFVTINLQGMTTSRSMKDEAPLPLLSIDRSTYSIPSVEKLMLLYNNYILETNENEVYTAQEKIEENNLLDTILSTPVMQHTRNFLVKKGKIGKDPKEFKDLLRLIWFNMYSRGGGRIGSSGFEHVFLAELKNNQVSGLHNWLYFNEEENKNRANYLGYLRKVDLGTKGAILKYHFTFRGVDKPVGSMFIGTSPELEIALYSTCFILRADRVCPLKMAGNRFVIRTFTYRYRGKNMIGSAFPEI